MDHLISVSKGHIPNLGALGPLLHVEKFVVVGGWWWWWWLRPILVLSLSLKLNKNNISRGQDIPILYVYL